MSEDEIVLASANDNTYDDMILPFQLQSSHLRGRVVRLGSVLEDILRPHAYPDAAAQLVAEACGLSLLLGGMLKFDGVFTLQAQGNGPVRMVIADLTTAGDLRGLAHYDADRLAQMNLPVHGVHTTHLPYALGDLLGQGYLAFTVDQGEHTERYQGIVELKGDALTTCVQHYFEQSEQIDTMISVAAGKVEGRWRAGGLMIQRLPLSADEQTPDNVLQADEDWARAGALLGTCTPAELIRPTLISQDLLFRLFHEEGVRVFNPVQLRKGCRCNTEKLAGVLQTMSDDDLEHMRVDGKITMTCEFCNKDFVFGDVPKP